MRRYVPCARLILLAALGILAVLAVGTSPAGAIPGDGAGANTPGTNSSVSPRTLTAGSTIHFTVSGYPAGEVVYVKIDDGNFCSNKGVHGACVVHQQRLSSTGTASGSFVLPSDLTPGNHWLRFLASKEMSDASGNYLGTKGWTTRRGSDFTVVTGGATGTGTGGTTGATSSGQAADEAVLPAGETLVIAAPGGSADPSASPTPSASETPVDPEAASGTGMNPNDKASVEAAVEAAMAESDTGTAAATRATSNDAGFPWVGTAGLIVMAAAAGALVIRGLRARGGRTARA
ncbi:hypothetical protein [Nocardioides sp. Kera G14]|uniref:hypothetical protein n=1 Tax=Nocardioides sp. Kera G14 TaxID=2884264 RepID=UPI001D11401B|nr:hypothetical protein [Nocardioides sp. Kera G14]UDY24273.1 hypothetical protein LH076_02955 [Nocardioides sp. Kera G14]